MKTNHFLALILVCTFHSFQSQIRRTSPLKAKIAKGKDWCKQSSNNKMTQITYDFTTGTFDDATVKIKYGEPIILKVSNINRIFYKPVIEGVVSENVDNTLGERAPAPTPSTTATEPAIENNNTQINEDEKAISMTLKGIKPLDSQLKIEYSETTPYEFNRYTPQNPTKLYEAYKKKIIAISNKYKTYVHILNNYNNSYNNYLEKIKTPDLTYSIYKKLFECSNDDKCTDELERSALLNIQKQEGRYINLNHYFEQKIEFESFLNSHELQEIISVFQITNNPTIVKEIEDEQQAWKNYITSTDKEIQAMNLHQKLNYVEILNRILLNEKSYEYVSKPIQAYGDYLTFDVDIKEKKALNDDYFLYRSDKKFTYKKFVTGGMRLDFGIGVSLDFGYKDQEYAINENELGKQYLLQKNKHDYTPKLVGLLHASRRSGNNWAYGFSLGTSLDVANFDINSIYIGPSLLCGRSDKIILTAGPSFRKIKQLNPEFDKYLKQEVLPSNFNLDDSKYVNNFKVGFFIAITYNLTNAQRGKFMQLQKSE